MVRFYYLGNNSRVIEGRGPPSSDEIYRKIFSLISSDVKGGRPVEAINVENGKKRRYPNYIPVLKQKKEKRNPFIVADLETVIINDTHVPYAAAFLVVNDYINLATISNSNIEGYSSEDLIPMLPEFTDRSSRMMYYL